MKTNLLTPLSVLVAGVALIMSVWAMSRAKSSIFVVDNQKLFDEFKLKPVYAEKLTGLESRHRAILDSLELHIRQLRLNINSGTGSEDELNRLRELYNWKAEYFRKVMADATAEYDHLIWKQIESRMKDFGVSKGSPLIIGKSTYDDIYSFGENMDVTAEALEFINGQADAQQQ